MLVVNAFFFAIHRVFFTEDLGTVINPRLGLDASGHVRARLATVLFVGNLFPNALHLEFTVP